MFRGNGCQSLLLPFLGKSALWLTVAGGGAGPILQWLKWDCRKMSLFLGGGQPSLKYP